MNDWFTIDKIDENSYIISEYQHWEETHCYLLNGETQSLLIDTGLGISNIYEEVRKLTDKPIIAIATHAHWDHIGGLHLFPDFYIHQAELAWINGHPPLSITAVKAMVIDHCILPDNFSIDEYCLFQGTPTSIVHDHDLIDLGNRVIEILHTPGHSPGHLCFWEKSKGYLFTGDLVYKDTLFAYYPSTDPVAYLASLQKINALPINNVFPGHHTLDIKPEIVNRMTIALTELAVLDKLHHGSGTYEYNDWSIKL